MKFFASCLILFIFAPSLNAQVASFTDSEIRAHQQNLHQITAVASDCLDWVYQDHLDFFNKWGVSKYYGNRRPDYKNREGLIEALKLYNKPTHLVAQLEPISCIGLTLRCLREGLSSAGLSPIYEKIHNELKKENRFYGTDLQKNLIRLGWKSFYWNPNPSQNKEWDLEDQQLSPLATGKKWNAVWGGHHLRYLQATQRGFYFEKDLIIHDAISLVGFNETQPDFFKEIPFFVGIAHAGYHVFPGRRGEVIEAHSMRNLNAKENLEYSEFNPLKAGGGPKWTAKEKYRSGVIVIPNF